MDSEDFKSFLKSYPWEPLFPLGSDIPIPTAQELEFANLISQQNFTCRDEILGIANSLDTSDFYTLITFSVRMAIFSMRVHDVKALKAGIVCFMIDENEVDYRDILRALSILEYCASKSNVNFHDMVVPLCSLASTRRR